MKVTTERPEPGVAALTIELPPEELEAELEKAWRRVAARTNVPGFRRGKAPRALVERHVGAATITEEAVNHLVPERYDDAIEQEGLHPIERPRFGLEQATVGEPLVFTARVSLRPEVTLGDVQSITVERPTLAITDDQVQNVVTQLRESRSTWQAVDSAKATAGTMIHADIVMDLEPGDESGKRKTERTGSEVIIGENGFPAGFDSGVDGMGAGDVRTFAVVWQGVPRTSEDGVASVEDRDALFTVTVHEVREKRLPDVDDAFVHDVTGGQVAGLEALRADIGQRLAFEATRRAHSEIENLAVDAAIALSEFEVAEALIDLETDYLAAEESASLTQRRLTLERYLQLTGQSKEDWRGTLRESAIRQLRARTLLDAVADAEGLQVSDAELDAEVAITVAQLPTTARKERKDMTSPESRRRIGASMRRHKSIEKLVGFAGGYPTLALGDAAHDHSSEPSGDAEGDREGTAPAAE